mgnify:CR=1 FL=1
MHDFYMKSLRKIKELPRILTEKEYNQIAKEEDLLSSESLKFISKKNFSQLCREIRREVV